jgi:hypothetical protein
VTPKHKLLNKEDRSLYLENRDDEQETIWRETFGESMFEYCRV